MRFEELASEAGRAAARVGSEAERPALSQILAGRRRRALTAGLGAAVIAVVIFGVVLMWPGSGASVPPAAAPTSTTTSTTIPAVSNETELPLGGPVPAGAPDAVADRVPLPYCGASLRFPNTGVNPFPAIELVDDADACYQSRAEAGQPVEMIQIGWTGEGDPILAVRRVLPDGQEETFLDMTRDTFGTRAWFYLECSSYQPPGSQVENCKPAIQLPAAEPSGPSTTLFDMAAPALVDVPETCPVTVPGEDAFTPASETPDELSPGDDQVWYGTPELWTKIQPNGQVVDRSWLSPGAKTFWWSENFPGGEIEGSPDITVTAEHLDGTAPIVKAGGPGTNGSHPDLGDFMLVGIELPGTGCWKLTAEYKGATVSYVMWVSGE